MKPSRPDADFIGQVRDAVVLVEGPAWGDAKFYGHWLLCAAKANEFLLQLKKDDPEFGKAVYTLEMFQLLDFGISATRFLSLLTNEFKTFVFDVNWPDLLDFALMAEMGFFALTGERYQMTLPYDLDMASVKRSHLKLAWTDDAERIHPERFVVDMPRSQATRYQRLLRTMSQEQRLADREALLRKRLH